MHPVIVTGRIDMKSLKILLPWLLAVSASAGAYFFYAASAQKEVELARLRPEVQELQTLRAENEELKKLQGQAEELEQLRKDNAELPGLRNEVRQLKEEKLALNKQTQTAQAQVQTAQAQAQAAQAQAQALRTNAQAGLTPELRKAFEQRYGLQPNGVRDPAQALAAACINNLRQIDGAMQQWALENKKTASSLVNQTELLRYFKSNTMPVCPAGGVYTVTTVGLMPICSIPGHALPK